MIYKIDKYGFIVERYPVDFDINSILDGSIFCSSPLPQPLYFYKPSWNGKEWVEGATQEEIEELTKVEPSSPTQDERINMLENMILLMMEAQ